MYGIRKQFPGVQHITSDQLAQMKQNEDVTLLVRPDIKLGGGAVCL